MFGLPYFADEVAVSEDGREVMIAGFGDEYDHHSHWWVVEQPNVWLEWSSLRDRRQCQVEWRAYESGEPLTVSPFMRPCWMEATQWSEQSGSGSFSATTNWFLGSMSP
jgi:hypothetical protein